MFDPTVDPVRPGGLTDDDKAKLFASGWKEDTTKSIIKDVHMSFSDPDILGGIVLRKVDLPMGTPFFYHPDKSVFFASGCGNIGGLWGD